MILASPLSPLPPLKSVCAFGQIDFINVLPITHVLRAEKPANMSLVMDNPGDLNRKYLRKELDLGAMSSHYFLQDGGFELFPDISISAQGPVGSVLFFSRRPLGELDRVRVGVPLASASSVQLLHILLKESYGVQAHFVPLARPELPEGVDDVPLDAFLLIGDRALTVDDDLTRSGAISHYERLDLGQWWCEKYKLPMVFGVWGARKSWQEANAEDFASIAAFLAGSYARGLGDDFAVVLAEASERTGLDIERLRHYYRSELDYTFTPAHAEGLALYQDLCRKYELL
ncbi:MAG: menaquinone biosynthesis protein [Cyanobacteria bacterium REEB67]|nr:menaquinone biosynthesis protein [Cyanobacteria bacterium REEB67]